MPPGSSLFLHRQAMNFFRLLKPDWGKKFIEKDDKRIPNPNFIREVKGDNTIEGIFDLDFIAEKNAAGYNIYWFPNHPSTDVYSEEKSYLNGKDIDVFDFLFIDMDLKDGIYKTKDEFYEKVAEFPLKPSLTVDSGNGVHVYWQMTDLTRDLYVIFQKRLIQHFNTDESIWTVMQIMRYPGSQNTKKESEFKQTTAIEELSGGGPYSIEAFEPLLPEITEKNLKGAKNHCDKLDGKVTIQVHDGANLDEVPDKFIDLMERDNYIKQLFMDPKSVKGDRSKADLALANHLFSNDFNRKEALAVIANSLKGLSKGANRMEYAVNTVARAFDDRLENKFQTVGEKLRSDRPAITGELVKGPDFFDCTVMGWRKGQLLGIIAGPGVGKTSIALKVIQAMIQNSERDEVFIFYSLEMPEYEIEERWVKLVGKDSPLANKLYVIGNEDDKGQPRNIGLQEIYWFAKDIQKDTGKEIGAIIIDHVHIVNRSIDTTKSPTFDVESEIGNGYGKTRPMSLNKLCDQLKVLTKMLNTFSIILTQTTKGKGAGDTPIGIDGAYGISNYEWNMDMIISAWQPLMRIQKDTDLRILAWQYCKIRGKHKDDPISCYEQQVLTYEMETGNIRYTSSQEYVQFEDLLPLANDARKANEKKESTGYSRGPSVKDLQKLKLV